MRRECRERLPHHRLQRKPLVSDPGMHHGTCVTHVPWCMSGTLNRGGGGKRSRHSRRMRNAQFYVSGKRPIDTQQYYKICLALIHRCPKGVNDVGHLPECILVVETSDHYGNIVGNILFTLSCPRLKPRYEHVNSNKLPSIETSEFWENLPECSWFF